MEFFDNMIRPVLRGGALNVLFANATSQMTSGNNVLASKTKKIAHTGVNRNCGCTMVLSTEIRFSHLHIRLHDVRNNAPLPPRDADDEHVPPNRLWFEKHEARVRHMPYNKNAQH